MSTHYEWMDNLKGTFLVFDGPDGSGKTTQFRRFADLAQQHGLTVCEAREPGGTAIGEQVRRILLDPENTEMDLRAEMLLYMASRAQLVHERIMPALARGEIVLADRFVSSTLAYQGTAGGVGFDEIRAAAKIACEQAQPNLVIIFDVDEQAAATRLNPLLDRMEAKGVAFHRRVREGFLQQARDEPDRHLVIDASPGPEEVFTRMMADLGAWIGDQASRG